MSHVSDVIDLYLYDLEVTDRQFRAVLHEAIEKDTQTVNAPGAQRLARALARMAELPGYSVKV